MSTFTSLNYYRDYLLTLLKDSHLYSTCVFEMTKNTNKKNKTC